MPRIQGTVKAFRSITLAFRSLQLKELAAIAGLPRDQFGDMQAVVDLVSRCDSFLTVRKGINKLSYIKTCDRSIGVGIVVLETVGRASHHEAGTTGRTKLITPATLKRLPTTTTKSDAPSHLVPYSSDEAGNMPLTVFAAQHWRSHALVAYASSMIPISWDHVSP